MFISLAGIILCPFASFVFYGKTTGHQINPTQCGGGGGYSMFGMP